MYEKNNVAYLISFALLLASPAFAQDATYKLFDDDIAVDQLPQDSIIQFNNDINVDQIVPLPSGGKFESAYYKNGSIDKARANHTTCKFFVSTSDQKNFGSLVSTKGFTIPKGMSAKVTRTSLTDDDVTIYFVFNQPIKTSSKLVLYGAALKCHEGTGTWWKNSDEKLHLNNVEYNLGNRVTFLENYIKPEMTKQERLQSYIGRLNYLLSILKSYGHSNNSYSDGGDGRSGVILGYPSGLGLSGSSGTSGTSRTSVNEGSANTSYLAAILQEINDLYAKIGELLKDPALQKTAVAMRAQIENTRKFISDEIETLRQILPSIGDQVLKLGGTEKELASLTRDYVKVYTTEDGLPSNTVWTLYWSEDKTLFVTTPKGLAFKKYNEEKFQSVPWPQDLHLDLTGINISRKETVFLVDDYSNERYFVKGKNDHRFIQIDEKDFKNNITAIDGNYKIDGTWSWSLNGHSAYTPIGIVEASDFWDLTTRVVSTMDHPWEGGVIIYRSHSETGGYFESIVKRDGKGTNTVHNVTIDGTRCYLATDGGIVVLGPTLPEEGLDNFLKDESVRQSHYQKILTD